MNAWLSDRKDVFGDAVDRPAAPLGRAGVRMGPPHSRPAQAPAPPSRETIGKSRAREWVTCAREGRALENQRSLLRPEGDLQNEAHVVPQFGEKVGGAE